ncbi:MAG: AMP-binding protein [Burkholderiaceae bacterium]
MNLASTLTQTALKWPHKTGLVFEGQRWTYREWNKWVNRTANAFVNAGMRKGDRVAFFTYNLPEQITGFYALMKIGAIPVPINYRLVANEVKYIIDDCGAKMLVFEECLREPVMAIKAQLAVEQFIYIGDQPQAGEVPFQDFVARASSDEPQVENIGGQDTALIMYTSGTTGRPKGVVRSHLAEIIGSMVMAIECGFRHNDVILHNKPLYHIAQFHLQLMPFIQIGGINVLTRGFDVHETLSLVESEKVTVLHGVPTQMVMLAAADLSQYDLTSLRCGFYGGQTLADDVTRKCMVLFPEYFGNLYGSTEALAVTSCDYRQHPGKLGSVGMAAVTMEVRVIRSDSHDPTDICLAGEIGQLIARGPSLFTEYWGQPEKTAEVLRNGWYFSGDAALTDDEGFITVMGRMDHTIKSGGENIHPSEIENLLFKHPDVANAAAVGLPSQKWGQVVCAAIVRRNPALDAQTLDAFCHASQDLAAFKRPRHYFFVDAIPSNPTGKVERGKLKDLLLAQLQQPLD